MSREQFMFVWRAGYKIDKILKYLNRDTFEDEETKREFKEYLSETFSQYRQDRLREAERSNR